MKIFCTIILFLEYASADDGVLDINVPSVLIKAQDTGNIALQSAALTRDLYLEPGPGGTLLFDNEDVLQIIKIAKSLPPVWLPHSHNGFFGTFQGGQSIHIKLEARDPEGGKLVYKVVAGDLPNGVTIDEDGGYLNGIVPDIERLYSFTIRAMGNHTKYADSVFKMEVFSHDNCKSNPCQHSGSCMDGSNNTYTCLCADPYGGQRCQTDCRSNAFGVANKNKIPDAQMSAYLSQGSLLASNGRYGGSRWCGTNNNAWLQVDLGNKPTWIVTAAMFVKVKNKLSVSQTGLEDLRKSCDYLTVGEISYVSMPGSPKTVYRTLYQYYSSSLYTGSYTLSVSLDGMNFHFLNDTKGIHSFRGGPSTYTDDLPNPTTARFVRYHPTSYKSGYYPCMRVELYGC